MHGRWLILEKLGSLLFELSSCDRLSILKELSNDAVGVTKLSKKLGLTTQETSRQVFRLKEAGLLRRDHRGIYRLTSYAEIALKQLEGLDFVSRHKEYFKSHSLIHLPEGLVLRLGDIADATYLPSISQAFYSVERLIKEAESYIWLVNDQISFGVFCELGKALERGTKNKVVQTKSFTYPSGIVRDYFQYYEKSILPIDRRSRVAGTLEDRLDDQVDVFLFISEAQAAVAFPLNSGKFDYLVFSGSDKRFHSWCSEVFNYCWTKAQPLETATKEPCEWIMDNPEALSALESIIAGRKVTLRKDLASKLENMQLTRNGNLTRLGYLVRSRLDEHRFPES